MGWMYSADGVWENAEDDDDNIAWARESWENTKAFGHANRSYLNFPGHGEDSELTRSTFGSNYERLTKIKAKYDPTNMFRFNQNISPEG